MSSERFETAPELLDWIRSAYIDEAGDLYTEEHAHLKAAKIGCLWTNAENSRHQRRIVGQAEMPGQTIGRQGKWQRARGMQQLQEWFGDVPDFLITIDAIYAESVDNASFCALIDHELFHCSQAKDEFGEPRFSRATHQPIWAIRGHDVEEFTPVVRRFGINAAGRSAMEMVVAASKRPEIAQASLARACGTCVRRAA